MSQRAYHLVDVFTDHPFGGNPLAVFLDGRGLSDALMQAIAKEFNLSETTFVLPPEDPANDFRVRIFTPANELPMAGHPTVGTAFVLTHAGIVKPGSGRTNIILEEGVGPIPVAIDAPMRSDSAAMSISESSCACRAAATTICANRSILRAVL